ncbi:MFS transporter [Xanthomonas albilineans]|uniref:Putative hexuronate transporter protein n=1 Tax=Xanthomonas albilineans (strain GPE PC73 / CFBP 7063) TaxID=380358 RepID=D2U8E9_XANAP|nr:MFS transporter [Xanthomonas albilineans]QHQ26838.1 putative hexuronate transporter protein [Xanthomonas albilineans]CBA14583.1 putative hexuronate transporter protein [Xanthomonas albilineans GPE PC73]
MMLPTRTQNTTAIASLGRLRWRICALLLAATTINYVDRQVLGVLAPFLQEHIGWNEIEYGYIVTAFQAAYALGLLCSGAVIDRFGTRVGYALAIGVWSLASMGHALTSGVIGFAVARFFLGLGESGNFPAAIKTVAEWFPRRERALATGIFNSGSNIGAIVAPLSVPFIANAWGWQWAFIFTGVLGAIWLTVWWLSYRPPEHHPHLSAAELTHIRSDPSESIRPLSWTQLLRHRQAWAFVVGKFLTDPVWWFFLFWLPKFLHDKYGLGLLQLGAPLIVIFLLADVGSIAGGWLAGRLLARGWSVNRARKVAMLVCALAVMPIVLAARADHLWLAVALIGLATAAHQGWSANLFTLTSDMFPRHAVASLVGIGGFAGAVGGMLIANFIGFLLQSTGSYLPVFLLAGSAYVLALGMVHLLTPRLQPAQMQGNA